MKKTSILIAVLTVLGMTAALTACGQSSGTETAAPSESASAAASSAPVTSAPETPAEQSPSAAPESTGGSNAVIGFSTQEYDGDNIGEIPYIEYDGEEDSVIDSINRSLNQGIGQEYDNFINSEGNNGEEWIEIRSYPFTSDKYLQVVVTSCTYPVYGTDGDLFSINYDKTSDLWLTMDDAIAELGTTEDDLLASIGELYGDENPDYTIDSVDFAGFLIRESGDSEMIELLLELTERSADANEPWTSFYSYTPQTNELFRLNSECLFDPYDVDQMNPPLACQQQEESGWSVFPDGVTYSSVYTLESDPGENITPEYAAELIVNYLSDIYGQFGLDNPIQIVFTGFYYAQDTECYQFTVSGSAGEYQFAVGYDGTVYELDSDGNAQILEDTE